MSTRPCCEIQPQNQPPTCPARRARRGGELAGWILPAATLALMPKCPACLAAYVALVTGIGLSFQAASFLRVMLLAICAATLVYVVTRRLRGFLAGRARRARPSGSSRDHGLVHRSRAQ